MLCFGKNAHFPQFFIQIPHIVHNLFGYDAEIVIFQFLSFWRFGAEKGTAAHDQIFPLFIKGFIDQKIFLFRSDSGDDTGCLCVAKQPENAQRLLVQYFHGTQKRRLFVQSLAAVGIKYGGDAEGIILDESIG